MISPDGDRTRAFLRVFSKRENASLPLIHERKMIFLLENDFHSKQEQ
jgi:hypothetical protein